MAAFAKAEEETTVLDALTDAAEALQMADLKLHAPDAIPLDDQVRSEDDDLTYSNCNTRGNEFQTWLSDIRHEHDKRGRCAQ